MSYINQGGPSSGTNQHEWTISDDGNGVLSGTLRIFIDSDGGVSASSSGGSTLPQYLTSANAPSLFDKYKGNNGLSNPLSGSADGNARLHPKAPKRGESHPYDGRLKCYGASITYSRMGIAYCDAQYAGLISDPCGFEWELSCPTEEEPIQLHPEFLTKTINQNTGEAASFGDRDISEGLSDFGTVEQVGSDPKYKCPYWNTDNVDFDFKSRTFKAFKPSAEMIEKRLVGVESFKAMRPTFRISFSTATTGTWSWLAQQVGRRSKKISYAEGVAEIPNLPSGQDWLLGSVTVTRSMGIYKVSTDWIQSGNAGGWNPIIYKELEDLSGQSSSSSTET